MDVRQVYEVVNGMTSEILGSEAVVAEDLSNIVDIGKAIFDNTSYDNYVKSLVDHIGKVVMVNRTYEGTTSELMRDAWEYGAVCEKIYTTALPEAVENESWKLQDGASYDPNVFHKPDVAAKFFNKRTTFEVDLSVADRQARSAFDSAAQLNAFTSMLGNDVDKALTIKTDALAERTINNMILQTFQTDFPSVSNDHYEGMTGNRAVNLLYLYNTTVNYSGTPLTAAAAIYSADFARFAAMIIKRYVIRLRKVSKLFNNGNLVRFTPSSLQHLILHGDFTSAAESYLYSDTYHEEFVSLPKASEVPYWQGSGTDYAFSSTSAVKGTIEIPGGSKKTINVSGVLGVLFDHEACGITNFDRRVTTNYNAKAEFNNFFYKQDAGYFNDLNENFIVFYIA